MFPHIGAIPDAATRQSNCTRYHQCVLLVVAALTIQGCAAPPPRPPVGPEAADPNVRVPAAVYRSAIDGFDSARPSEPAAWSERNDGATPPQQKDGP